MSQEDANVDTSKATHKGRGRTAILTDVVLAGAFVWLPLFNWIANPSLGFLRLMAPDQLLRLETTTYVLLGILWGLALGDGVRWITGKSAGEWLGRAWWVGLLATFVGLPMIENIIQFT